MKRIIFILCLIVPVLSVFSCSKTEKDQGPWLCVNSMLENAKIVSGTDVLSALDPDIETEYDKAKSEKYFQARENLETLFANKTVQTRILAALRAYDYKDMEHLKTVTEEQGIYVVVYLRSDSDQMGEPVSKRPGWRKALFRVEKKEEKWMVADLDYLIKNFGDKPFYNLAK